MSDIDDIQQQLETATGIERVDLLNRLALAVYGSNPQLCRQCCEEALTISQEIGYLSGIAASHKNIGVSYWAKADYEPATHYFWLAVQGYEAAGDFTGMARAYNNLGVVNQHQARYVTALDYFIKGAEICERIGDYTTLSTLYLNLSDIYTAQENHNKALEFTQKALELFRDAEDNLHLAGLYNKIGEVHTHLKQFDVAYEYTYKAIGLAEKFGSQYHVAFYHVHLAKLHNRLEQYELGRSAAEKALSSATELGNKRLIASAYTVGGESVLFLKEWPTADDYLHQGLNIAHEVNDRQTELEALRLLSGLHQKLKEFEPAFYYYRAYTILKEKIAEENHRSFVAEMQLRYEVEKTEREAEIYRLKTEELESLVQNRTTDLAKVNERLSDEAKQHQQTAIQLIEARDRAEEANRAKSSFLTNMSHELRTPLNAIIGYSEILREESEERGDEEMAADLKKILWSAHHLLGIINDILNLSKIEAGKMEIKLVEVEVSDLIEAVVIAGRPLLERHHNQLVVRYPSNLPPLQTDDQKVRQVLLNLLSNAAKFTDKGQITLTAEQKVDPAGVAWLVCQVIDTGIGMNEEQQSRLFRPFTQLDSSTTRAYEGTGLGLVITQHFCHMLGGSITLHSQEGVGSTFTITLPWVSQEG